MESLQRITADVEKNKTGMTRFIVSQVPKSEAPGPPSLSGDAHFSSPAPGPPAAQAFLRLNARPFLGKTRDQSKGAPLGDRHQPILIAWMRGVDGGSATACAGPVIGNMM